jgi:hypothetical protein
MMIPITVVYGKEHAGCAVRLYTSLAGGSPASVPVTVENAEKWSLTTDGFETVGSAFLDENGRKTFQVEEQEGEQQKFQAAVEMVGGWRLSNLIEMGEVPEPVVQTVTVQFEESASSTPGDTPSELPILVSITTSDSEILAEEVTVDVRDLGTGTANSPTQYTMDTPQTLTFPAGTASGDTQSAILTNTGVNGVTATVDLDLNNPDGADIGEQNVHIVTIGNIGA